jgi:hypothetical protein
MEARRQSKFTYQAFAQTRDVVLNIFGDNHHGCRGRLAEMPVFLTVHVEHDVAEGYTV